MVQPRLWLFLAIQALLLSMAQSSTVSSRRSTLTSRENEPSSTATPCTGVPTVQRSRRACGFYIWDAPSALLYKWCHHLLKDHLYEGRGGHMFVRYESNSILQLLYPCSRYSPNRCLICGGNYADHLELWWSNHLYTPFDRNLDKTYEGALALEEEQGKGSKRNSKQSEPKVTGPPTYAFHKRYVQDVSALIRGEKDGKAQLALVKQEFAKDKKNPGMKVLRFTRFPQYGVAYVIPQAKEEGRKALSLTLRFARSLVLSNLDNFIVLQETENEKLRN